MIDQISFIEEAMILTPDPKDSRKNMLVRWFPLRPSHPPLMEVIDGKLRIEK